MACDKAGNCITKSQVITIVPNPQAPKFVSGNMPATISCTEVPGLAEHVKAIDPMANGAEIKVKVNEVIEKDACGNDYLLTCTFSATGIKGLTSEMVATMRVSGDACAAKAVCQTASQSAQNEWIKKVSFDKMSNESGAATYSDFTQSPIEVTAGGTYPVAFEPGFAAGAQNETWTVWIDLNKDGQFSTNEQAYAGKDPGALKGMLHIPANAEPGDLRMRVAMSRGVAAEACTSFAKGEIEDYTLRVKALNCETAVCASSNSAANAQVEYINSVKIGTIEQLSGASKYSDYTGSAVVKVNRQEPYALTLNANSSDNYDGPRVWKVYADYNRDGDFADAGELVASEAVKGVQKKFSITVPANALPGLTVLRVVLSRGASATACTQNGAGEVEDYSLYVIPTEEDLKLAIHTSAGERGGDQLAASSWSVAPNPAVQRATLSLTADKAGSAHVMLMDMTGRVVLNRQLDTVEGLNQIELELGQLSQGIYRIALIQGNKVEEKPLAIVR